MEAHTNLVLCEKKNFSYNRVKRWAVQTLIKKICDKIKISVVIDLHNDSWL